MTSPHATINFPGNRNQGSQVGVNSGSINNYYGGVSEQQAKREPFSTVPFNRDPHFVDRGDTLKQIHEKCSYPAARVALVGLGGVGKSQLAIQYSYQVRTSSPQTWVFWVHASTGARFEEGYKIIADRLELPGRDDAQVNILQLVSNWLCDERNGRWVMIVDNADGAATFFNQTAGQLVGQPGGQSRTPPSLATFLPQTQNGCILFTSRSGDVAFKLTGSRKNIIKVGPMDQGQGLALLRNKLGNDQDETSALDLLQALGYMPLAITQAAAYISRPGPRSCVSKYLDQFRKSDKSKESLLNKDAGDLRRDTSTSNSIIITWQISFEQIREERPSAAELLSLMSFFNRQGIPDFVIRAYAKGQDTNSKEDPDIELEEDVATLSSYCLITTDVEGNAFDMHQLVQFSTRKWLEAYGDLDLWRHKFLKTLSAEFPTGEYENWSRCQVLFPHAEAVVGQKPADESSLKDWASVLHNAGWYARAKGSYITAERMARKAVSTREKVLGKEHPSTLASVNSLALVLRYQGKYEQAEELHRRALEGSEKVLGKEHPDTLTSVDDLAVVLQYQGKYEEAEELHRRALEGRERVLGKEHPDTLTSVNNLAGVLRYQGKYKEAEEMNRRALEGYEKMLGKEHPDTLTSVNTLAGVLQYQGKYKEAEEMNRRALEGYEKILGKEHPDTLTSVNTLAGVLQDQGKYEQAEELYRRDLEGSEKVLGKEHPDTLTSIDNLAGVLQYQGKYEQAEELHRRALEGSEKVLGKEHPDTLTSVDDLAVVLQYQGKYEEAEELHRRALEGRERVLGKEHPDTLTSVYSLAYLLHKQQRYEGASVLYQRAYDGYKRTLGVDHPTTLACSRHHSSMLKATDGLATSYNDLGHGQEALQLRQKTMEPRQGRLKDGSPGALTSMSSLAASCSELGCRHEAAASDGGMQGFNSGGELYPLEKAKPKRRDKLKTWLKKL